MRLKVELIVLAVLVGVLLGRIPDTLGRSNNVYSFFDTLVDIRNELVKHYVDEPDEKQMLTGAIEGMIESFKDPYTDYFSPESLAQFDKNTRGTFSGIGAQIGLDPEGRIMIVSPLEGSPAYKAGIMAGDVVLEIAGKSTEGLKINEAVKLITGEEGTEVKLKVRHPGGEEALIGIVRQKIKITTVKGFRRDAEHHWDFMIDRDAGIGYVRITQFSARTLRGLTDALEQAKKDGMKGLIMDLRFNPGGLLDQAISVSDLFLSKGRIVSTKGRNSPERVWEAKDRDDAGDFPMVVLVNEYSASASEIVSGALKDNDRAVVVGTRTFGKGSVQQVLALEDNAGAVKVTTALYYLPSGRSLHRKEGAKIWGVDPNEGYYVPMNHEQIREMNKIRAESDVIKDDGAPAAAPPKATPKWLEEERADPQLAAALRTMLARLDGGKFTAVGRANATLQAHVTQRATLETSRDNLQKALDKVNTQLKELEQSIAEEKQKVKVGAPAADAGKALQPVGAP
ncbi:MAG: S41 family peptidase [Phycisphaerae bacterium]|nr:S41 family peptidase [Phycisphaerae bacterium]